MCCSEPHLLPEVGAAAVPQALPGSLSQISRLARVCSSFCAGLPGISLVGSKRCRGRGMGAVHEALGGDYPQRKKPRRASGYHVFMSEHCAGQPSGFSLKEKNQRARHTWRRLGAEERDIFNGRGTAWAAQKERLAQGSFADFCNAESQQAVRRASGQSLRRKATMNTWESMKNDLAWGGGLGLQCLQGGIKPDLVCIETDKVVHDELEKAFHYDGKAKPNRQRSAKVTKVCSALHGGLCMMNANAGRCDLLTKNLYNTLKETSVVIEYPLFIKVCVPEAPAVSEYHLLTRMVNKDDLAVLVEMEPQGDQADLAGKQCSLSVMAQSCKVSALHMAADRVVRRGSAELGRGPDAVSARLVTCMSSPPPQRSTP